MTAIIGVDCATAPDKVGLALGRLDGPRPRLLVAQMASRIEPPAKIIAGWLRKAPVALLALDAPLGWPAALGPALQNHTAGRPIPIPPNDLFRRTTDKAVRRQLGRQPLDVGADRIARTAHAALALLDDLRDLVGQEIPLAWQPITMQSAAVEVYPAGTLLALGLPAADYKQAGQVGVRHEIVRGLAQHIDLPADVQPLLADADALDAAICVLAGADFQQGIAVGPPNPALAKQEGWIWVRPLASGRSGAPD